MAIKQQLSAELYCHAANAIRELGGAGFYYSGVKQSQVRLFQKKWNQFYPYVKGNPRYYVLPPRLIEDGMYGPNTASCMDVFVEAAFAFEGVPAPTYVAPKVQNLIRILPRRAVDVAAWYVQWRSVINQMCPKGVPDTPPPPPGPVPGPDPTPEPLIPKPRTKTEPAPKPRPRPRPVPKDNTRLLAGIGLAAIATGALWWSWGRGKKKGRR
jgi:hypothetical protein